MVKIYSEVSRTFGEYLLLPNLTQKNHLPQNVSLATPIVKYSKDEIANLRITLPFTSAVMQSVSNDTLAIALAKAGGLSFIYHSQPIERQVEMVKKVKGFRAGFVTSDSNLTPTSSIGDAVMLSKTTGHNVIAITEDGKPNGKFLGLLSRKDLPFDIDNCHKDPIQDFMVFSNNLYLANIDITLEKARNVIWDNKLDTLPVLDEDGCLQYLVFRKDFDDLKKYSSEVLDNQLRLLVGAGVNTHDYKERIPKLLDAGADVFVIDSSDGYSEWQLDVLKYTNEEFGGSVKIGAGNVVDSEGFRYLAEGGAHFVKVGIGGGSICITREQKGIGRGSASALLEVASERDKYFQETGVYIPLCMDGGVSIDYHIVLSLALGADFVMMGRYFARFDESPGKKVFLGNRNLKEYWAEGSNRAANWARYDLGGGSSLKFEEGIDGFVPYAGDLYSNVNLSRSKIISTFCNCGALSIKDLREKARLVIVSDQSIQDNTYQIERRHSGEIGFQ